MNNKLCDIVYSNSGVYTKIKEPYETWELGNVYEHQCTAPTAISHGSTTPSSMINSTVAVFLVHILAQ